MCSRTDPKALPAEIISTPPHGGPCRDHVCFGTFAASSSLNTHGGRASLELFHSCPPVLQPQFFPSSKNFHIPPGVWPYNYKVCSSSASLFCINNNYLYPEETTPDALLDSKKMTLYALLDSEETTLCVHLDSEETTLSALLDTVYSLTLLFLCCKYKVLCLSPNYFQLMTLLLPKKLVSFGVWTATYTPFSLFLPPVTSNFLWVPRAAIVPLYSSGKLT